jgi:GT2 family glycosyltransferase
MISHIIFTWNLWEITQGLLNSLYKYTDEKYLQEIIIIDNGSTDETIEKVRQDPRIKTILLNKENVGFAHSCNQGIKLATQDLIAIWNNDTEVNEDWLPPLLENMEKHKYYMIGAAVVEPRTVSLEQYRSKNINGQDTRVIDFAKGAPWIFKRQVFDLIGGFDERFFPAQCEDSDFFLRMGLGRLLFGMDCSVVLFHHSGLTQTAMLKPQYGGFNYAQVNKDRFLEKWGTVDIDIAKAYHKGDYFLK